MSEETKPFGRRMKFYKDGVGQVIVASEAQDAYYNEELGWFDEPQPKPAPPPAPAPVDNDAVIAELKGRVEKLESDVAALTAKISPPQRQNQQPQVAGAKATAKP